jgi:hypothetical protein
MSDVWRSVGGCSDDSRLVGSGGFALEESQKTKRALVTTTRTNPAMNACFFPIIPSFLFLPKILYLAMARSLFLSGWLYRAETLA